MAFQHEHFCTILFFNSYMYHFHKNLEGEKEKFLQKYSFRGKRDFFFLCG